MFYTSVFPLYVKFCYSIIPKPTCKVKAEIQRPGRNEKKLNYRYTFVTYCALAVILDRVQSGTGQFPEYIADFIVQNSKKDTLQYGIHSIKKGPVPMHRPLLFIHFS